MLNSLLKDGIWSLAIRLFGVAGSLLVQILLARVLSKSDMGAYFLLASLALFGALLARFGMRQTVVKFVAESLAEERGQKLRSALKFVFSVVTLGIGVVLLLGYGLVLPWVFEGIFEVTIEEVAYYALGLWIALLVYQAVISESYRGLHKVRMATLIEGPAGNLLLLLMLIGVGFGLGNVSLPLVISLTCLALAINTLWHGWRLLTYIREVPGGGSVAGKDILLVAFPIYITNICLFVVGDASLWIAGAFLTPEDVADFGVALKLILVVTMPLTIVNLIVQPKISRCYSRQNFSEMELLLRGTATVATLASLVAVGLILLYPQLVLSTIFGPEYVNASTILVILALGKLVHVYCGSCGNVLALTGNQGDLMKVSLVIGAASVFLSLLLVGTWGTEGIALAATLGWSTQNIVNLYMVRKRLGIGTNARLSPRAIKLYLAEMRAQ